MTINLPPPFNPADGVIVREPERPEPGYWVGCPSLLLNGDLTWLTYRERRPRGAPAERGWVTRPDGAHELRLLRVPEPTVG